MAGRPPRVTVRSFRFRANIVPVTDIVRARRYIFVGVSFTIVVVVADRHRVCIKQTVRPSALRHCPAHGYSSRGSGGQRRKIVDGPLIAVSGRVSRTSPTTTRPAHRTTRVVLLTHTPHSLSPRPAQSVFPGHLRWREERPQNARVRTVRKTAECFYPVVVEFTLVNKRDANTERPRFYRAKKDKRPPGGAHASVGSFGATRRHEFHVRFRRTEIGRVTHTVPFGYARATVIILTTRRPQTATGRFSETNTTLAVSPLNSIGFTRRRGGA